MQNDDAERELWIDILLDDRKKGWARSASVAGLRVAYPDRAWSELEAIARRHWPDRWAYFDELNAKPSSELRGLANAAAERLQQEREAAERMARQDRDAAMFFRWACKPYWLQQEAAVLVCGGDPDKDFARLEGTEAWEDLNDLLTRAIKAGKLAREMSPLAVLDWLRSVKVGVPEGLAEAVDALRPPKPIVKAPPVTPPTKPTFEIEGYDCPAELLVLMEAINKFWVNTDRSSASKQSEIFGWIRERVDSDSKAKAIDALIRPQWARNGGNKKWTKV